MSTLEHKNFQTLPRLLVRFVAGLAVTAAAHAASAQQPTVFADQLDEVTATVTAIDSEQRLVSLETEDGRALTVEASDEVRNFEQIEVGDQVDVKFYEAFAAEVTEAPASTEEQPVVVGSRRAALGERPAGAVGLVYTAIVTIDAVDPETGEVRFTGPGGQPREVSFVRPELQEFAEQLKPGDRVEVTYGEAMAIAVTPKE